MGKKHKNKIRIAPTVSRHDKILSYPIPNEMKNSLLQWESLYPEKAKLITDGFDMIFRSYYKKGDKFRKIHFMSLHSLALEYDDEGLINRFIKEGFPEKNFDYDLGESYIIGYVFHNDIDSTRGWYLYGVVSPADNDGSHPENVQIMHRDTKTIEEI